MVRSEMYSPRPEMTMWHGCRTTRRGHDSKTPNSNIQRSSDIRAPINRKLRIRGGPRHLAFRIILEVGIWSLEFSSHPFFTLLAGGFFSAETGRAGACFLGF